MKRIREHPDFGELPEKDQDNLLLAALLHDSGKRANVSDPDHRMAGSNLVWGVLGTLGYSPVRIQRVANLVARHSEMSYRPGILTSERLQDPDTLDNIATFYRHPSALKQLRIFNESDIKSINATSSLWTGNVEAELDRINALVQGRVQELNTGLVPILTTEVPSGFGLVLMSKPYAFFAHVTPHLEDSFLKQLSLIESPEYSISLSLITPQHHQFYYGGQPTFALVTGPWEQIAQAYRENFGDGNLRRLEGARSTVERLVGKRSSEIVCQGN